MANTNTVFGARLFSLPSGGRVIGTPYICPASDHTALYLGDFVKLTGESALWSDGVYYPVVTQAAATDTVVGWVTSMDVNPNYLNQLYRTADTLRLIYVMDDPWAELEIQSNGTFVAGDVGQTADIVVASGSIFTGLSGMQLDHNTLGDSKQLKILTVSPRVGSELGAYTKVICLINKHAKKVTTGV